MVQLNSLMYANINCYFEINILILGYIFRTDARFGSFLKGVTGNVHGS